MTTVAIITMPTGIIIGCDGGGYLPDGTLAAIGGKVILIPEASALITGRGSTLGSMMLQKALAEEYLRISFDGLLEHLPSFIEHATDTIRDDLHPSTHRFSTYLAGWSERRQAYEAWAFRSYDSDGGPAYAAHRLPECYLAPAVPQAVADFFGLRMPETGDTQWRSDPQWYATMAVCASRFCPGHYIGDDEGTPSRTMVAAFVQISGVTRGHVSSRIVHEWPDQIGELVDPKTGDPAPGMTLDRDKLD